MVHTLPPWTSKYKMATIFGQIDQGELATRLGSINTFDRRGDTVYMDDFEASTLKWEIALSGTGAAVALSTGKARNGDQSCKLTAGSTANKRAIISKYVPLPVESKIGYEASFTIAAAFSSIFFNIYLYTGTKLVQAVIHIDEDNDRLQYLNSAGDYTTFASDILAYRTNYLFNTIKLVIDYDTGYYVRCMYNKNSYDLSTKQYRSTANAANPYLKVDVSAVTTGTTNPSLYVDDVILTQNEP